MLSISLLKSSSLWIGSFGIVDAAEMIGDAARRHRVELRLHGGVGRRRDHGEFLAEAQGVGHADLPIGIESGAADHSAAAAGGYSLLSGIGPRRIAPAGEVCNVQVARIVDGRHDGGARAARRAGAEPRAGLPDGEAKVLVEGLCTMCHQTNMITASMGYTPRRLEGTDRHDARPVGQRGHAGQAHRLSRDAFPAEHPPRADAGVRARADFAEGMGDAAARPALARSGAGGGRLDLVRRAVRQPDGQHQSGDRRDQGIRAAGQRQAAHRRARCQGQHLVHRQHQRLARLSRSEDRQDHGLQDARPQGEGPAHAGLRQERASAGSRCRTATWSGASIRRAATSSSSP